MLIIAVLRSPQTLLSYDLRPVPWHGSQRMRPVPEHTAHPGSYLRRGESSNPSIPEVDEWGGRHMFVLLLWIVIANGLLFLLLAILLGSGTWS
jgi:hypothetical protein